MPLDAPLYQRTPLPFCTILAYRMGPAAPATLYQLCRPRRSEPIAYSCTDTHTRTLIMRRVGLSSCLASVRIVHTRLLAHARVIISTPTRSDSSHIKAGKRHIVLRMIKKSEYQAVGSLRICAHTRCARNATPRLRCGMNSAATHHAVYTSLRTRTLSHRARTFTSPPRERTAVYTHTFYYLPPPAHCCGLRRFTYTRISFAQHSCRTFDVWTFRRRLYGCEIPPPGDI